MTVGTIVRDGTAANVGDGVIVKVAVGVIVGVGVSCNTGGAATTAGGSSRPKKLHAVNRTTLSDRATSTVVFDSVRWPEPGEVNLRSAPRAKRPILKKRSGTRTASPYKELFGTHLYKVKIAEYAQFKRRCTVANRYGLRWRRGSRPCAPTSQLGSDVTDWRV